MKRGFIFFLGAFAVALIVCAEPSTAQLLYVTGRYRVVDVDPAGGRIGVALPNANPHHRQNWVYIKPKTRVVKREYLGDGTFRDEFITYQGVWKAMERHVGDVIKVHGGRDWDGSINAEKIWM